jgi:hypothetical protein
MAKRRYHNPANPEYPTLGAAVAKWRWRAREGLQSLTVPERHAYGETVERAILALQRRELLRGLTPTTPKCHCASGTAHNTGEAIHNAIREQQLSALLAAPSQIRRARTNVEWRRMYEEAMAEKRVAIAEAA